MEQKKVLQQGKGEGATRLPGIPPPEPVSKRDPIIFLVVTTVSIFCAELFLVYLISRWRNDNPVVEALLNAGFLAVLSFPILYYSLYQPLLRRAEESRRIGAQLQRLATALESAGEAVLITDTRGTIAYVNPAFERITGYRADEAIGQNPRMLKSGAQEEEFYHRMWQALKAGEVWRGVFVNQRKDGTLYHAEQTIGPVRDPEGRTTSYVGVQRDITDRIRREETLQRLSEQKDNLLGIASHDLKNTLTSILGVVQILEEMMPPGATVSERVHELVSTVRHSAQNMYGIILDFLDFQAMEDGQLKLERTTTKLNELARRLVQDHLDYAESKQTQLVFEPHEGLPRANVDVARIEQVVQNYINNAIKFCPQGSRVVVSTRSEEGAVVLEVSDNGPGLKEGDLKRVFTKYSRLSNPPTGGEKSFGLGLAICKQIIDLHGGECIARNNPSAGATFGFRLPAG